MRKRKVELAYITNDSARKASIRKRKKGLIKKLTELTTLCDIDACAIIYSPYDAQPEVYPSELGVHRVLDKLKMMPKMEQSKRKVNQESFLQQQIAKANEQLKKQKKENREKEMTQVMFQSLMGKTALQGLSTHELNDLSWLIERNLKDISKRMKKIGKRPMLQEDCEPRPVVVVQAAEERPQSGGERDVVEKPKPAGFEANVDSMPRPPQWLLDLMNLQEQQHNMGFGGEEEMLPFGENGNNWSNGLFP